MPVAVSCEVKPAATEIVLGERAIDFKTGAVTVIVAALLLRPVAESFTVTVVLPTFKPVTKPVLLTLAVVVAALVQVTLLNGAVLLSV